MKTKIRQHHSHDSYETSQEQLHHFLTFSFSLFPIFIGAMITLMCLFVVYLAAVKGEMLLMYLFIFFSSYGFYFIINLFKQANKDYHFTISSISSNNYNIRNSYNYFQTPELKTIAQRHIWRDVYSLKHSTMSVIILAIAFITIPSLAFIMDYIGIKESSFNIFIIIFLPIIAGILFLFYSKRRFIKKIQSSKHNFLFCSLQSKNYKYSVTDNTKGGLDFIFRNNK